MSDESLHRDLKGARPLRSEEKELLRALLLNREDFRLLKDQIEDGLVLDMADGGMGSLRFISDRQQTLGQLLAEAEFSDEDGIPVSIVVNADLHGRLFELDIWKSDFSELKEYPVPGKLRILC